MNTTKTLFLNREKGIHKRISVQMNITVSEYLTRSKPVTHDKVLLRTHENYTRIKNFVQETTMSYEVRLDLKGN